MGLEAYVAYYPNRQKSVVTSTSPTALRNSSSTKASNPQSLGGACEAPKGLRRRSGKYD